jgi:hypothetical protein
MTFSQVARARDALSCATQSNQTKHAFTIRRRRKCDFAFPAIFTYVGALSTLARVCLHVTSQIQQLTYNHLVFESIAYSCIILYYRKEKGESNGEPVQLCAHRLASHPPSYSIFVQVASTTCSSFQE